MLRLHPNMGRGPSLSRTHYTVRPLEGSGPRVVGLLGRGPRPRRGKIAAALIRSTHPGHDGTCHVHGAPYGLGTGRKGPWSAEALAFFVHPQHCSSVSYGRRNPKLCPRNPASSFCLDLLINMDDLSHDGCGNMLQRPEWRFPLASSGTTSSTSCHQL